MSQVTAELESGRWCPCGGIHIAGNHYQLMAKEAAEESCGYVLTDLARRELALEALFGPWPTVAEAIHPEDRSIP